MLIVISYAAAIANEAHFINSLFDEGLQLFHLRKPEASASEIQQLLKDINPVHHLKISLHQHHAIAKTFRIKRLHFPEAARKNTRAEEYIHLKQEGYSLSTSVHDLEENVAEVFNYAFYGPVFNSISKKGYTSTIAENSKLKTENPKLIAIGGVDENNCTKAFEMGFAGVAVLGAIWQSAEPIKQFKKLHRTCSLTAQ